MITFLQKNNYGLGNTINCTPALQAIYEYTGKPVVAYFENKEIEKLFVNANFLTITDELIKKPTIHSGMINLFEPDWMYVIRLAEQKLGVQLSRDHHTYVDQNGLEKDKNLVVMVRGCANEKKRYTKDPGDIIYIDLANYLMETGFRVVFTGSHEDFLYNQNVLRRVKKCSADYGNILKSKDLIEKSAFIIANDTGFYHVAGAMKKDGLIMWKDTDFMKNKSPNDKFIHSFNSYFDDFLHFNQQLQKGKKVL